MEIFPARSARHTSPNGIIYNELIPGQGAEGYMDLIDPHLSPIWAGSWQSAVAWLASCSLAGAEKVRIFVTVH
jgi:hypothetical protein